MVWDACGKGRGVIFLDLYGILHIRIWFSCLSDFHSTQGIGDGVLISISDLNPTTLGLAGFEGQINSRPWRCEQV